MSNKLEQTIQRLVASKSDEEAKQVYAEWQSYDSDLDAYGYIAPQLMANKLIAEVDEPDALIYDAGCGTGKVGAALHTAGYQRLEGSDLSESMLERAEALGIYQRLSVADFAQPLAHKNSYFDAAISVGVWKDHFGPNLTNELLRIVKPGGHVALSIRPQFMPAFDAIADILTKDETVRICCNDLDDYIKGQQSTAHYVVMQKLA